MIREKLGSRGRGPGTQHLSRKSKLAMSVLIDLIGMSSYLLPVLGQVCECNLFAPQVSLSDRRKIATDKQNTACWLYNLSPVLQLYEVQDTFFSPSYLEAPLALCRRNLGSERQRHAIALPDKLGTDPMAYGGIHLWTPPRKSGRIP